MRKILLYVIASFLILLASCDIKDDFLLQDGWVGTDEVWAKLHFGHRNYEQVDISTRATLSEIAESRIENVFVYIFDHEGKRVYSHFYDYNNKVATLPTTVGNYWTVSNRTPANNKRLKENPTLVAFPYSFPTLQDWLAGLGQENFYIYSPVNKGTRLGHFKKAERILESWD